MEKKMNEERLNDRQIRMFVKRIAPEEEGQLQFIAKVALTFGLRYSQIAKIFRIPDEQVGPLLRKYSAKNIINGLDNLYSYGFKEPDLVLNEFYDYINNLYQAYLNRNREDVVNLLGEINDIAFARFHKNHEAGAKITPEEAVAIIKYQVKYFITNVSLCKLAKINNDELKKCHEMVAQVDPVLAEDCQKIIELQTKDNNQIEYYSKMKSVQANINRYSR